MVVLCVDDDRLVLSLVEKILESSGYTVITATNGIEALELLEHHEVATLLTDIRMPKMDGITLAGKVKQQMPEIQIILMTGYAELGQLANDYVVLLKPFYVSTLLNAIQTPLDRGVIYGLEQTQLADRLNDQSDIACDYK